MHPNILQPLPPWTYFSFFDLISSFLSLLDDMFLSLSLSLSLFLGPISALLNRHFPYQLLIQNSLTNLLSRSSGLK